MPYFWIWFWLLFAQPQPVYQNYAPPAPVFTNAPVYAVPLYHNGGYSNGGSPAIVGPGPGMGCRIITNHLSVCD